MRRSVVPLAFLAVFGFVLPGCGGGGNPEPTRSGSPSPQPLPNTTSPVSQPAKPDLVFNTAEVDKLAKENLGKWAEAWTGKVVEVTGVVDSVIPTKDGSIVTLQFKAFAKDRVSWLVPGPAVWKKVLSGQTATLRGKAEAEKALTGLTWPQFTDVTLGGVSGDKPPEKEAAAWMKELADADFAKDKTEMPFVVVTGKVSAVTRLNPAVEIFSVTLMTAGKTPLIAVIGDPTNRAGDLKSGQQVRVVGSPVFRAGKLELDSAKLLEPEP